MIAATGGRSTIGRAAAAVPGINTNDMEATLQFYCGILGMRLVRTTRTPDGRRHYNVHRAADQGIIAVIGLSLATCG